MSTLRDVRRTSMDYVLSMEALMHTTSGLKPEYLPERDVHYLLSGVTTLLIFMFLQIYCFSSLFFFNFTQTILSFQALNMLTLSFYMDERSTRYKQEALGRVRVALAGSALNCFYSLLTDLFSYPTAPVSSTAPSASASTSVSTAAPPKPSASGLLPSDPALYKTIPDIGSGSEAPGSKSI